MKFALILLGALAICSSELRSTKAEQVNFKELLAQLRSTSLEEREKAAKAIVQAKSQIENKNALLVEIEKLAREFLADKTRAGSAKTAITLLGELKATESVPILVENLTFVVFYKQTKRIQPIDDLYPCSGALIKIGAFGLDALFAKIERTDDETVMRVGGFVVANIVGNDANNYVQNRIDLQRSKIIIVRLTRLQKYVKLYNVK